MGNFTFDKETHEYLLNGKRLPSVTQILQQADLLNFKGIDKWYATRGKALHLATEYYDQGCLDSSSVHPEIAGYLEGYKKFKAASKFIPIDIELRLYHPHLLYAGTMDRVGRLNNHLVIVEMKTGSKKGAYSLQVGGYYELCKAHGIQVKKGYVLYLTKNGTYNLVDVGDIDKAGREFMVVLSYLKVKENYEKQ